MRQLLSGTEKKEAEKYDPWEKENTQNKLHDNTNFLPGGKFLLRQGGEAQAKQQSQWTEMNRTEF